MNIATCFVASHLKCIFFSHTLQALENEMEAAMAGMQFPTGSAPGDGENPECQQS